MDKLLSPKEASEYLNITEKTLANARWSGIGTTPKFIKLGSSVRYKQSELDAYIESHTHKNTGEAKELRNEI
jgi:predicted DNA-binding transcriptional regulator AlpA